MKSYLSLIILFLFSHQIFGQTNTNGNGGLVITFDDIWIDEWIKADSVISENIDWKATFFVNTKVIDSTKLIRLNELHSNNHEIGGHGYRHLNAQQALTDTTINEYLNSEIDSMLLDLNDFEVTSFAYPYGARNEFTDSILLTQFDVIRGTTYSNAPPSCNSKYFYDGGPVVYGLGIDHSYHHFDLQFFLNILEFARNNNKIVTFYAHRPDSIVLPHWNYNVSWNTLNSILSYAQDNGMNFYTISELLNVEVDNDSYSTATISSCDSYLWIDGNTYTSSNNSATFTLTNAAGCDSIVTLDLTINNSNTGVDTQVHCDTYTWIDGNTYTSSNNSATCTLTNAAGCDSVVTLNLIINPSPEQLTINQYWSTTFNTGESFAYQWYLNGELLENDTTKLLNFMQGGSYTVEAINSFGCKTMSDAFVIGTLERTIGREIDFIAYPNPTNNLVFIELMEEFGTDGNIIVSDLFGQIVKTIELKESISNLIDLSMFKNGPYIITVKYPNGLQLSKTIIKN